MIRSLRNPIFLAVLLAGTMTLSGCWDIKDINHRSLPVVMGVKRAGGTYKVLLVVPNPNPGQTNVNIITQSGITINEILDKIDRNMEKKVDLLHLKVIIFERSVAEKGLSQSIESFMRARDISDKTFAAISDGPLEPLFDKLQSASESSGTETYDYFEKNAGWSPEVVQTRIWEVFRSMNSFTRDDVIPIVKPGLSTTIESAGSAVIRNGKMVGVIDSEESLLYNLFKGAGTQGKIEVMDHATVKIVADRLNRSSAMQKGRAIMKGKLRLKVTVLETVGSPPRRKSSRKSMSSYRRILKRCSRPPKPKRPTFWAWGSIFATSSPGTTCGNGERNITPS